MSTWHDLNPDETIHALDTDLNGLTEQEVKNRRSIHGKNKLKEPEKTSSLLRFFSQYHDPLNYLLIAAAITVPPVAVAIYDKDIFLTALNAGSTFGITTLFLLLPAATAFKERGASVPLVLMVATAVLALSSAFIAPVVPELQTIPVGDITDAVVDAVGEGVGVAADVVGAAADVVGAAADVVGAAADAVLNGI